MKKTITWTLALIMALSMVVCLLPAAVAQAEEAGVTIYVATDGNDDLGDGSQAKPYATIQKAVNEVPANNTTPTTILIADGVYNVHVPVTGSSNLLGAAHNLVVAKSNLTIKAENPQKVVIYGYSDTALTGSNVHAVGAVVHVRNFENVTFDGLVILPHFMTAQPSISYYKKEVSADDYISLIQSFLGDGVTSDLVAGASLYSYDYYGVIRTDSYAKVPSNGSVATNSGLTFQNCYLGNAAGTVSKGYTTSAILLDAKTTGDYHFIGNTIRDHLIIKAAGSNATNNEIIGNTIGNHSASNMAATIKISGVASAESLPLIKGNTFTTTKNNIAKENALIYNTSAAPAVYTAGALSVMCQTNTFRNNPGAAAQYVYYTTTETKQAVTTSLTQNEDTTVDTEEELAYWLTQEGEVHLAANITLTESLPEEMAGTLVPGSYTITKEASLVSYAPEGYAWANGTALAVHTHVPAAAWSSDDTYHWHACTADSCLAKLDKATHAPAEDDHDCTTPDTCAACGKKSAATGNGHVFDNDCTTDDECRNEGCTVKTDKTDAHTFTDDHDTTCNVPGCIGTQEQTHIAAAKWEITDEGQHYRPCAYEGCTAKLELAEHTSVDDNDCTTAMVCSVCYAETAAGAAAHTFDNCHDTTCNVPGCTGTQEDSHDWSAEWMSDGSNHWRVCSGCDEKSEQAAHTGTAVCTAKATCKVCGTAFGEIDPNNHSMSAYTSNDDATCVADGTKSSICQYGCGLEDKVADEGSALGHKFTNYVSNDDATCVADGTKTASCDNGCGETDTVTDEGTATGHKFTKYLPDSAATCTADATKTASCNNGCGETDTVTVEGSAKGHSFAGKDWQSGKDGHWVCCDCGEKNTVIAHTGKLVNAKDATEEAEGYTGDTVCEVCNYEITKGEVIPALKKPVSVALIVIIAVAVVAVGGGVAAYLVLAKKKKQR